jgi:hypothetical protein
MHARLESARSHMLGDNSSIIALVFVDTDPGELLEDASVDNYL